MVRRIKADMEEAEFDHVAQVKQRAGLSWEKFLVAAAAALDEKLQQGNSA